MPKIIPVRDLKNTAAITKMCEETDEPIYITKNGYAKMVLLNANAYDKAFAELKIYEALKQAEDDPSPAIPASEVFKKLRTDYDL